MKFGNSQPKVVALSSMKPIYLDYNATSPLDPRVLEVTTQILEKGLGNASSAHYFGRRQSAYVDEAREQVSAMLGCRPSGVVFTSGATEANNLVLQGLAIGAAIDRKRVLISAIEHASVQEPARWLEDRGIVRREIVPVLKNGQVNLNALEKMIGTDVLLVSVMSANSETGVLNPIGKISELAHSVGSLFHCDATQSVGRLPFDMEETGADFVSTSSHKICGPTGVGALAGTRSALRELHPILHGGGHERGLRSGSLNVAGIVGFGAAAAIATKERVSESRRVGRLRDKLASSLQSKLTGVYEVGDTLCRLANTANIRFEGADAEAVAANMDPVAISTGSACASGSIEPSPTLLAMGISRRAAGESVRFSLGRFTTPHEIDLAVECTVVAVCHVRETIGSEF